MLRSSLVNKKRARSGEGNAQSQAERPQSSQRAEAEEAAAPCHRCLTGVAALIVEGGRAHQTVAEIRPGWVWRRRVTAWAAAIVT